MVVINNILKYTNNIVSSVDEFEHNAKEVNDKLKAFCEISDDTPYIVVNPQRGFPSKSVQEWSDDGVHMRIVKKSDDEYLSPMQKIN